MTNDEVIAEWLAGRSGNVTHGGSLHAAAGVLYFHHTSQYELTRTGIVHALQPDMSISTARLQDAVRQACLARGIQIVPRAPEVM